MHILQECFWKAFPLLGASPKHEGVAKHATVLSAQDFEWSLRFHGGRVCWHTIPDLQITVPFFFLVYSVFSTQTRCVFESTLFWNFFEATKGAFSVVCVERLLSKPKVKSEAYFEENAFRVDKRKELECRFRISPYSVDHRWSGLRGKIWRVYFFLG